MKEDSDTGGTDRPLSAHDRFASPGPNSKSLCECFSNMVLNNHKISAAPSILAETSFAYHLHINTRTKKLPQRRKYCCG